MLVRNVFQLRSESQEGKVVVGACGVGVKPVEKFAHYNIKTQQHQHQEQQQQKQSAVVDLLL